MVTTQSLQSQLDDKIKQIQDAVAGLSNDQASVSPTAGEWSVNEILSHLCGDEQLSFHQGLERFLAEDTPEMDLTPGQSYLSEARQSASVDQLLADVVRQYSEMSGWIGNLTPDQLQRTAHLPNFKETPLGDYPSLQLWIGAIINFHLMDHVQHLQKTAAASK